MKKLYVKVQEIDCLESANLIETASVPVIKIVRLQLNLTQILGNWPLEDKKQNRRSQWRNAWRAQTFEGRHHI